MPPGPPWVCEECTWENLPSFEVCNMCATLRGSGRVASYKAERVVDAATPSSAEPLLPKKDANPQGTAAFDDDDGSPGTLALRCPSCGSSERCIPKGSDLCSPCADARDADRRASKVLSERQQKTVIRKARVAEDIQASRSCCWAAAERRAAIVAKNSGNTELRERYFVVCSDDEFVPHEMTWNATSCQYRCTLQIGEDLCTRFNIITDGSWQKTYFPSCCGSSSGSLSCGCAKENGAKTWVVQKPPALAAKASFLDVKLRANESGKPLEVESFVIGAAAGVPSKIARRYWVVGSWDDGSSHEMNWDPVRGCFHWYVTVGSSGTERFQIHVDDAWHQCYYPEGESGHFYNHSLCGPDSFGSDCWWIIGDHWLDAGAAHVEFEIRLRITDTGSVRDLDWVRITEKTSVKVPLPTVAPQTALSKTRGADDDAWDTQSTEDSVHGTERAGQSSSVSSSSDDLVVPAETTGQFLAEFASLPIQGINQSSSVIASELDFDRDSDGEEIVLCSSCKLPLPELAYGSDGVCDNPVHGECLAQRVVENAEREEADRLERERELKAAKRVEYEIGWKPESMPDNSELLCKLGCDPAEVLESMYSMVYNQAFNSVEVVPTSDPAESINVGYLSLALQVRVREGREPVFSLDPFSDEREAKTLLAADKRDAWMQAKRFEPAWLAGTSVGEVLFQADYHLKELSMGEKDQPVANMRSARDFIADAGPDDEWNAREWFVVRKAAIHASQRGALMPAVSMGVDAREQVMGANGLEDAKITRPDHPLVQYAESFTDQFELIAERRSVICQLRELAKATALAKFLVESNISMDDAWFGLANRDLAPCIMSVPQLWNERCYSEVRLKHGRVEGETSALRFHGIYGGVELGMGDLQFLPAMPAPGIPSKPPATGVRAAGVRALRHKGVRLPTSRLGTVATKPVPALQLGGLAFEGPPQGVDLRLNEFNLTEITPDDGDVMSDSILGTNANEFWALVESSTEKLDANEFESTSSDQIMNLLRSVFAPGLHDRRNEKNKFLTPDLRSGHARVLSRLVERETSFRQRRRDAFLSAEFNESDPGVFFPSSWVPRFRVDKGCSEGAETRLRPWPEWTAQKDVLQRALVHSTPTFEKRAEDGTWFKIYKVGQLEVRVITEPGKTETIGQVFVSGIVESPNGVLTNDLDGSDPVHRVTLYVEPDISSVDSRKWRYFTILDTVAGKVVTEKFADGSLGWQENPAGLDVRISQAKVLSSSEVTAEVTVRDMKLYKASAFTKFLATPSKRKRYAQSVVKRAIRVDDVRLKGGAGLTASVCRPSCTGKRVPR